MKNIVILGSTGKIGTGVLEVVRAHHDEFKIVGLSTNTNVKLLKQQVQEFKPLVVGIGEKDLVNIATLKEVDLVVVAVVGLAGLLPTLAAIKKGKNIALATKEVLVVAGEIVTQEAKKNRVRIIPIDSEHSAIFQCLHSGKKMEIKKLILTMGKGPIAKMNIKDLEKVTINHIINRPEWDMGNKITIDCATCINKSFEVIEAKWLFNVMPHQIEVVVHPEYMCHSLVEFKDGSIIAELGTPDMKRYIQYALFYPHRKPKKITKGLDIVGKKLSFEKTPYKKFPGLQLGFYAIKTGGTMPAVLHGADETAVKAFISRKISFTQIPLVIQRVMDEHKVIQHPNLKQILISEKWGREFAHKIISN